MIKQIVKRDGRTVDFELDKIAEAIFKAAQASGGRDYDMATELAGQVESALEADSLTCPTVEQVQDVVEGAGQKRACTHGEKIYPLPQRAHPRA